MSTTVLPDLGPQLAQALAGIGQGLSRAINPLQDVQHQVRAAILADPKVGARLAELERQTPGTIESLLGVKQGDRLFNQITGIPKTAEIIGEDRLKGAYAATPPNNAEIASRADTGMSAGQAATSGVVARGTQQNELANPNYAGDVASVQQAGGTQPVVEATTQAARLKGALTMQAQHFLSLQPMDDQAKIGAFAEIPNLLDEDQFKRRMAQERELFGLRDKKDLERAIAKDKIDEADQWVRLTGKGKSEDWQAFLYGDETTRADPKFDEIRQAMREVGVDKLAAKNLRLNNSIAAGLRALNAKDKNFDLVIKDPSVRKLQISTLQSLLDQKALFGGPQVKVEDFREPSFGGLGHKQARVVIKDKNGNELPDDMVTQDYALPQEAVSQGQRPGASNNLDLSSVSVPARQAWSMLQTVKDTPNFQASIDNLKKQKPALYQELKTGGFIQ